MSLDTAEQERLAELMELVQQHETTQPPRPPVPEIPRYAQGPVGWICPVCGAGLAPYTAQCSCTAQPLRVTC